MAITTIREATDAIVTKLENAKGPLGLNFVGAYDEKRIPRYPAVVVTPSTRDKTLHGLSTFNIGLRIYIYVYHADLTETKRERSQEDLRLVEAVEGELESDYTLGGQIIFGYVSDEQPGLIQSRTSKSSVVIGTRISWEGLVQRRF